MYTSLGGIFRGIYTVHNDARVGMDGALHGILYNSTYYARVP